MAFLDDDFLLSTDCARELFHGVAASLPIIDYHCHISPREIAEDVRFENIAQVWLGGDHYKWRLMRAAGVDERLITGNAPDRDKFQAFCKTMELAIGNPVYQWSALELRRFFGYEGAISGDSAQEIWDLAQERLAEPSMSARGLMRAANVELICTTDDPADDLRWHSEIATDGSFDIRVLPAWRPDKVMAISMPGYAEHMDELGEASGIEIRNIDSLREALLARLDFFASMGASISDHSLDYLVFEPVDETEVERIFKAALVGEQISTIEKYRFWTWLMRFLGEQYTARNWVMQLHYGVERNVNRSGYARLGADAGYDCVNTYTPSASTTMFLSALREADALPKTILYSLNPADNLAVDTICGCFQEGPVVGKMQHGSAWWFNDNLPGMREHLTTLASQGLLGCFVGMLTDSRSFLSYPRHEYFRRVLCGLLGEWVEAGMYPCDHEALTRIVCGVCHDNAKRYFGW